MLCLYAEFIFIISHAHIARELCRAVNARTKRSRPSQLDRHWSMPNKLVDFLCNLPKTAQALPVKPLHWLVRQIWLILDEKVSAF